MNTSVYYTLMFATAIVAEAPSNTKLVKLYTSKSTLGEPLKNTQFKQTSEMPATPSEHQDHHATVTVKIENIIPYKTALLRSSFTVSRLTKSFNNDYDPFFIKKMYMPAEKKPKMIKVVPFRRNRLQPRIILQDKKVDSTVAEKQSPFNELLGFSIDSEK